MNPKPAFLPGFLPSKAPPFARFLPPVSEETVTTWLRQNVAIRVGNLHPWVLDPFGAAPGVAIAAARAGYRVMVTANNPVTRFLFEMAARPPTENELRSALASLASSHKGSERLELHIKSFYETPCAACGSLVQVEAFLWEKGAAYPYARIYHCPVCRDAGERPVDKTDRERLDRVGPAGLHRARALERVASVGDPDREHVEEALDTYLTRSIYVLFTLFNKLESLPQTRRGLTALLLSACDQATSLWPYPTHRPRPRQLVIPNRFRENNIWSALEEAVELWAGDPAVPPLMVTTWPELPAEQGGICLYEGRLKNLMQAETEKTIEGAARHFMPLIEAVVTTFPRPNQAYWTLSALWAGWLWGRDVAAPVKSVLRRRRYDWGWHCTALQAALENLRPLLQKDTPLLTLVGENEPGFFTAGVLAGSLAGYTLTGLAVRDEENQAQIHWKIREPAIQPVVEAQSMPVSPSSPEPEPSETGRRIEIDSLKKRLVEGACQSALDYLHLRREPANFLYLQAAALGKVSEIAPEMAVLDINPAESLGMVQTVLQQAFISTSVFIRQGGGEHTLEGGQWWLVEKEVKFSPPLADLVEIELVNFLKENPGRTYASIDSALCARFPGLLTPETALIQACLDSYGEQVSEAPPVWRLNSHDQPKIRRADLEAMGSLVRSLGKLFGFQTLELDEKETSGRKPLVWMSSDNRPILYFYLQVSALAGQVLLNSTHPAEKKVLVIPGSRVGLLVTKIQRDFRLRQAAESGWKIIKFRHLYRLAESLSSDFSKFEQALADDPLTKTEAQLSLF